MARTNGPLFSESAAGPFARTITFQRRGGKVVARSLPTLTKPYTPPPPTSAQQAQRAAYAAAVSAWNALTPEARAQWKIDARPLNITGYNLFVRDYLTTPTPPAGTVWDGGATTWDGGATLWDTAP